MPLPANEVTVALLWFALIASVTGLHVLPSVEPSKVYPVRLKPPVLVGAVQLRITPPTMPDAVRPVGAAVKVAGVPVAIAPAPTPAALIPLTRTS